MPAAEHFILKPIKMPGDPVGAAALVLIVRAGQLVDIKDLAGIK